MPRTLAQVQTTLGYLRATYDSLAQQMASSMAVRDRQIALRDLEKVRVEIEKLEEQEATLAASSNDAGTGLGIIHAQMDGDPQAGL